MNGKLVFSKSFDATLKRETERESEVRIEYPIHFKSNTFCTAPYIYLEASVPWIQGREIRSVFEFVQKIVHDVHGIVVENSSTPTSANSFGSIHENHWDDGDIPGVEVIIGASEKAMEPLIMLTNLAQ